MISISSGALVCRIGGFLLAAVVGGLISGSAGAAQVPPAKCDNKCRLRFDYKDPGGGCLRFGIEECNYCTGTYGNCQPKAGDPASAATACYVKEDKGNIRYVTDSCDPVCPWSMGTVSESVPQSGGEATATIVDLWKCKL